MHLYMCRVEGGAGGVVQLVALGLALAVPAMPLQHLQQQLQPARDRAMSLLVSHGVALSTQWTQMIYPATTHSRAMWPCKSTIPLIVKARLVQLLKHLMVLDMQQVLAVTQQRMLRPAC